MDNLFRGLLAGFTATVVLSALMIAKSMMGIMPDLNAIHMLAGMAHQRLRVPATASVGWALHFLIGTVAWGSLYALLERRLPGNSPVVRGILFGTGAWIMMMIAVMPMAGAGIFGLRLGLGAPVATWMLHAVYGAVLGGVYGRLTHRVQSPGLLPG